MAYFSPAGSVCERLSALRHNRRERRRGASGTDHRAGLGGSECHGGGKDSTAAAITHVGLTDWYWLMFRFRGFFLKVFGRFCGWLSRRARTPISFRLPAGMYAGRPHSFSDYPQTRQAANNGPSTLARVNVLII
jgi:hypothetical protein